MEKKHILCFFFMLILSEVSLLYAQQTKQTILAAFGDEKITSTDFQKRLKLQPHYRGETLNNKSMLTELLNQMVRTKLLAKEARITGIDKDEEVSLRIEESVNNLLAQEYVKREVLSKISITEDELKHYFDEHKDKFIEPEKIRVRHILIRVDPKATPEIQRQGESRAREILRRAMAGEDLASLATEFSEDQNTKVKGGDLWYFSRGRMPPEFEEVAFALRIGNWVQSLRPLLGFISFGWRTGRHSVCLILVKQEIRLRPILETQNKDQKWRTLIVG